MSKSDPTSTAATRARILILVALVVATMVKILWAANSGGSVDAVLFFNFARGIEKYGLCEMYRIDTIFNHTPLTGSLVYGLYRAANGEYADFAFLLRFLSILADVVVVIALTRNRETLGNPPTWALVLLAASPVSVMVSGFHGNVDPVMIAVLFLAVIATVRGSALWSGLLLGLACMVKVVPLPMCPLFFFYWLARGRAWTFALACGGVGLAGTAWPLMVYPAEFLRNVLGYGSHWGVWGFTYLLHLTGLESMSKIDFRDLTQIQLFIAQVLKIIMVSGMAIIGWRRRNEGGIGVVVTVAACWVWFFVFAPGMGVQYFVWPAPFLLIAHARGYAVLTATSTALLAAFYHLASKGGWRVAIPQHDDAPGWSAVGAICWLSLIAILVTQWRTWWNPSASAKSGS